MFGLFKKKNEEKPSLRQTLPELAGMRLGGSFKIDDLSLKMMESNGLIENADREVLIEAVGTAKLGDMTIVRYYTDDEGFFQFHVHGSLSDENISEAFLFYYHDSFAINGEEDWQSTLDSVAQASMTLKDQEYQAVYESIGEYKPLAIEEVYYDDDDVKHQTDQFFMLYKRDIGSHEEFLLVNAEEIVPLDDQGRPRNDVVTFDHALVQSIGYPISPNDIELIS